MARLERPVMNTRSVTPAATASSTAYWISGLSTIGIISLGLALVAGRKRLPRPATGNTAFVTFFIVILQIDPAAAPGPVAGASRASRASSSITATPSLMAFSSLLPASAPATT
jgi:hypothetical protein